MGWETGISLGANAISGVMNTDNALAQSKAIAQSADYSAANIANKTSRTEGTLETSFIKGGIALDNLGGTNAVFQQAGAQGITDINRTVSNANNSISNTLNASRTQVLNGIAGGFAKLGIGSIQSAWNGMTGNLDPSPTGTADMQSASSIGSDFMSKNYPGF